MVPPDFFYNFWDKNAYHTTLVGRSAQRMYPWKTRHSPALLIGVLVVVLCGGLLKLIWLALAAPAPWLALLGWFVLPAVPFALAALWLLSGAVTKRQRNLC